MAYMYFRFYFLDSADAELVNLNKTILLKDITHLGIKRVSLDLHSTNKSLSILCQSEEPDDTKKSQLTQLLLENKFPISQQIEHEVLEEEHCSHHTTEHDAHHEPHRHHEDEDHHHHHENHWLKAALGFVWGISLLALSLSGFVLPLLATYIITGFSALLTFYLGYKVYQSAWSHLLQKKWDMSLLYTISTLTIVTVSILSLFIPGLPLMLESAPLILGIWHLGEGIEHSLLDKINNKLDVRDCAPVTARLKDNPEEAYCIKKLMPNDVILIKEKEVIPIDGIVLTPTLLYTTRIDGSPYPKAFKPGDAVKAGMCLAESGSTLELKVTKTYSNSYLSLVAKNIEKAQKEKAPLEQFTNKVLRYFIPGLLVIACTSGILISIFFPPALAIQCVISVLVSACPCALSLITPLAIKIGMKKAAEHGVHFKNGKTLQATADIDTFVFDLNGTLTQGKIQVKQINIPNKKILPYIALLESQSSHPIAKAIHTYIKEQGVDFDESLQITSLDKTYHSGIKGLINGELWMVGNQEMLFKNGIRSFNKPYDNPEKGSIYIVQGSEIVGQLALIDPLREDALITINQLKSLGKSIHICTGADKVTAEKYAHLLGIPKSNLCTNTVGAASESGDVSKTSYINQLKKKGCKVAMVGDAANDIPALTAAHVGIAVKSDIGDVTTEQHAGMVLQQGVLFPIATAADLAKKTKRNIFENLLFSLTYNTLVTIAAAGLFIAVGFALNPVVGVILMVLESTLVLLNLYRLKHQTTITPNPQVNANKAQSSEKMINSLNHTAKLAPNPAPLSQITPLSRPLASTKSLGAENVVRFFPTRTPKQLDPELELPCLLSY